MVVYIYINYIFLFIYNYQEVHGLHILCNENIFYLMVTPHDIFRVKNPPIKMVSLML